MSALSIANPVPCERRLTRGALTSISLARVPTAGSALAFLVFLPVVLRQPRAEWGGSGGISESTGG